MDSRKESGRTGGSGHATQLRVPRSYLAHQRGWTRLLSLLAAFAFTGCLAGPLAGTNFPFEPCIKTVGMSRLTVSLKNTSWISRTGGTRVCFVFSALPAADCYPGGYRCCNTGFNKFKFYADPACRRAITDIAYQTNVGRVISVSSVYFEDDGDADTFIGKITTLPFTLSNIDGGVLCWTLVEPCPTLAQFTHPATRDLNLFEIALYDKKVDNYESAAPHPSEPQVPATKPVVRFTREARVYGIFLLPGISFDDARARCGRGGGFLVSVMNTADWVDVQTALTEPSLYGEFRDRMNAWIGVDPTDTSSWLDGGAIRFWPNNQPPRVSGLCITAACNSTNGQRQPRACSLEPTPCTSRTVQGFICKTYTAVMSYIQAAPSYGKTYVYSMYDMYSSAANTYCRRLGGRMVSYNTPDEFNMVLEPLINGAVRVQKSAFDSNGRVTVWLGFADPAASRWVDGTPVTFSKLNTTGAPGCYIIRCPYSQTSTAGAAAAAAAGVVSPLDACTWELLPSCMRLNLFICELPGVFEGSSGATFTVSP
ncbi:hypothetical protein VOLCADRAFT_89703 [Volvox carteri f. nagariensis]|uniref:C-type lectin domain-containing protein n=1 Tax=Volvox carteri f. nagariensis TaxID=3068 RepID=D8TRV4_VOLCA|nr:uncharacterized protein VOLCADRAFT_89703 [Volvox carteri f. nagariensis]EFJ49711.1 hypothetical protein VOLCADRAFT_89703 [Volvox carteri f. nagariensis]|eukprot:XP_002949218.1 hypothetical protein VOLCADRAFT_89703 [Volvox carteri f. nagariensis]